MSHLQKLIQNGVILASNVPSQPDVDFIENSLTDAEVDALCSVHQKATSDFLQRNCSVNAPNPAPGVRVIGIVF